MSAGFAQTPTTSTDSPKSQPFYLHFLQPIYYNGSAEGEPPERILTIRVIPPADIFVVAGKYGSLLEGHIEARGAKFFVKLDTRHGPSGRKIEQELELEKLNYLFPDFFSGAACPTELVLSSNPDCEPFLKQLTALGKVRLH